MLSNDDSFEGICQAELDRLRADFSTRLLSQAEIEALVKAERLLKPEPEPDAQLSQQAELKQAWGDFLTELGDRAGGWHWWVTLTFRDLPDAPEWTRIGWGYSGRAWDTFIKELGLRKGLHGLWWVRGREYQRWRGVPHFHGLIGGVSELRRDEAWSWWFHRYGINRIEPYDRSLGAGFYLCKYVTKELGDIQFSPGLTMKT